MELDARTSLRRFCYLGSLDPVYRKLRQTVHVKKFWPKISAICKRLDDVEFLITMREVFNQRKLGRRDEALFVYAVYLSTDLNFKWKANVRIAFPAFIRNDKDLFIFCKYSMSIQRIKNRRGFSRTTRRAVTSWYDLQSSEAMQDMWMLNRAAHGFTHKVLFKLCHVTDKTIGAVNVARPFFKRCSELAKMYQAHAKKKTVAATYGRKRKVTASTSKYCKINNVGSEKEKTNEQTSSSHSLSEEAAAVKTTETNASSSTSQPTNQQANQEPSTDIAVNRRTYVAASVIASMSRLRTTKNINEALKIIQKYKLHYVQVPRRLTRYAPIMEVLIPTMSCLQLLKCWRSMVHFKLLKAPKILQECKSLLDKNMYHKHNIHPIVLLLKMHELGVMEDYSKVPIKRVEAMRMPLLRDFYLNSFGHNQGTGLRMHITINLQRNYMKKILRNHKTLSYIDAAISLAFGYYKKESNVDVFYWAESSLFPVSWNKKMTIEEATACCNKIENKKNKQNLVVPVINSLTETQIYDVFLAIVPSAGRGNPGNKSETLCKTLDKYRQSKNPHAKYVIMNLRKFKPSMRYSKEKNENILEICGLDERTADAINNFALNHFG